MFASGFRLVGVLAALALFLIPVAVAAAADGSWTGAVDLDWSNPANWTGASPPGAGDLASFAVDAPGLINVPADLRFLFIVNANVSLTSLAAGSTLTLGTGGLEIDSPSTLTVAAGIEIIVTGNSNGLAMDPGTSLTIAGQLTMGSIDDANAQLSLYPTSAVSVGTLGVVGMEVVGFGNPGDEGTLTITSGGIVFLNDDAELDVYTYMSSDDGGNDVRLRIHLTGDIDLGAFDNCLVWLDMATIELNGNVTMRGTGANPFAEGNYIGELVVGPGETFTLDASLVGDDDLWIYELDNQGTVDLGAQDLTLAGARLPGVPASFHNVGTLICGAVFDDNVLSIDEQTFLDGMFTFDGTFTVNWLHIAVTNGSTAIFNGDVTVEGNGGGVGVAPPSSASLGADEDGAVASGPATLIFNANVAFLTTFSLTVGEGYFSFAGNVDLGGSTNTPDVVFPPGDGSNDVLPQVHLIGTTQQIDADSSGSFFAVSSVGADTRVTQTGKLYLLLQFDTSGATDVGSFTVWDASAAEISLGFDGFDAEVVMTMGAGDITVGTLILPQVSSGAGSVHNEVSITGGSGTLTVDDLTIEGDSTDDDGGSPEDNAPVLTATGLHLVITATMTIKDGPNTGADGNGGDATFTNCTIDLADAADFAVGVTTPAANGAARLTLDTTTVNIGAGGGLSLAVGSIVSITDSTLLGQTGSYLYCSGNTASLEIITSSIGGSAAGDLAIATYSDALTLAGVAFSNYNAGGVNITGTVVQISDCTFTNGVDAGQHITLGAIDNTTDVNLDNNLFDDSVGVVGGAGTGLLVSGSGPFIFRAASDDFGIGAFDITAAQAEADGDSDAEVADQDVRWDGTLPLLTAAASGSSQVVSSGITDGSEYTVLDFTLSPAGAAATIDTLAFTVTCASGLDTATDIASGVLYYDADDDGVFGALEQVATQAPSGNTITFSSLAIVIADLASGRFALRITFGAGAGKAGTVSASLNSGGLTVTEDPVLSGLPVSGGAVPFTGPATQLVVTTQPAGEVGVALSTQPVIELRDASGNLVTADSTTSLTASIKTGPSGGVLSGTVTITAVSGVVTFTDLGLSVTGGYVLTFDDGVVVLTVDSAIFNVDESGGGGGGGKKGGCAAGAAGSDNALVWWLLLALLGAAAWRASEGRKAAESGSGVR